MQQKISIVMTSYNYSAYIGEAIESVLAQTYTNWELIIVDDGSTDNSVEIINKYVKRDSRIKLLQHPNCANKGLAKSVKLGIDNSASKWIAFLESDDKLLPNALKDKIDTIDTYPNIDLIFSELIMFDNERRIKEMSLYFELRKQYISTNCSRFIDNFSDILLQLNIIPTFSVVMVKKDLIQKCNFNSIRKASLDWFLWAQLAENNVYYLNKPSTEWRLHENSYITTDSSSWLKKYFFYASIYYQTVKSKPLFVKLWLTTNYMRVHLLYIKLTAKTLKVNFLNGMFIWEKSIK